MNERFGLGSAWQGPWRVIYSPCRYHKGGRSQEMNKKTALEYMSMFEEAKYIERTIRIWKWEITLRRYK